MAVARTGLLDNEAAAYELAPFTASSDAYDHKAYYPGAQIAGYWKAGVAKRIDVYATALFHGMTVEELNGLDLSYTPPLSSPWDVVQLAAQTWCGVKRDRLEKGST